MAEVVCNTECANIPYYGKDWADLPADVQAAATDLGYTEATWDADTTEEPAGLAALHELGWNELPQDVKADLKTIGYNEGVWEDQYNDYDFDELTPNRQEAAGVLGYSTKAWNQGLPSSTGVDAKCWSDLTSAEKSAAMKFGYNCYLWEL